MPKFIKNMVKDFLNIYVDENNMRESYGNEYADRFPAVNPATGKKIISPKKLFIRGFIVFMLFLCAIVIVRMVTYDGILPL